MAFGGEGFHRQLRKEKVGAEPTGYFVRTRIPEPAIFAPPPRAICDRAKREGVHPLHAPIGCYRRGMDVVTKSRSVRRPAQSKIRWARMCSKPETLKSPSGGMDVVTKSRSVRRPAQSKI